MFNDKKSTHLLTVTDRVRRRTMRGLWKLYIQNDLTFRHRQELSQRRSKARMNTVDGGESSRSDVGVSVAGSSGMRGCVGTSRGRGRGSGRGQVLERNQCRELFKIDRILCGSSSQAVGNFLN